MFVFAGRILRHYQQSSPCFEYLEKSPLKQILTKFSYPKKFWSKEKYYKKYKNNLKECSKLLRFPAPMINSGK